MAFDREATNYPLHGDDVNDAIGQASVRWPQMQVVDFSDLFAQHPEWHLAHGFHPNALGQSDWRSWSGPRGAGGFLPLPRDRLGDNRSRRRREPRNHELRALVLPTPLAEATSRLGSPGGVVRSTRPDGCNRGIRLD